MDQGKKVKKDKITFIIFFRNLLVYKYLNFGIYFFIIIKLEWFDKKLKSPIEKKANIQCPDCGEIFVFNEKGECFCEKCDRVFFENEVRARCGV